MASLLVKNSIEFSLSDIHGVRMDIWYSITGAGLKSLEQDARYPDKPDSSKTIENMASPLNMGDHYGLRLRAYFVVSSVIFFYLSTCNKLFPGQNQ